MAGAIPRPHPIVTFVGRFGRLLERAVGSAFAAGAVVVDHCPAGADRCPDAGSLGRRSGDVASADERLAEGKKPGASAAVPGHLVCTSWAGRWGDWRKCIAAGSVPFAPS